MFELGQQRTAIGACGTRRLQNECRVRTVRWSTYCGINTWAQYVRTLAPYIIINLLLLSRNCHNTRIHVIGSITTMPGMVIITAIAKLTIIAKILQ